MPSDFYREPGLNVDIYPLRTSYLPVVDGDAEFYTELARETGGPVLELGCGAGRLLAPLANAGFEITGLDMSPAMLAAAAVRIAKERGAVRRRIATVLGDMSDFRLETKFAFAFIAFRSFMMLTEQDAQRRCLERVRDHLLPGGLLAIDIFDPKLDRMVPDVEDVGWTSMGAIPHPTSLNLVSVEVAGRSNDVIRQVFEETWRFTERDREGNQLRREEEILRMRWTYRYEMRYLLELAGFEVLAEYSDYDKSPPDYGREQIWVARRR